MALIFSIVSLIIFVLYLIVIILEKTKLYHFKNYQLLIEIFIGVGLLLAYLAKRLT